MPPFQLVSDFQPTGDQPRAIEQLLEGVQKHNYPKQTLLGATGTGKSIAHDDPVFIVEVRNGQYISRVLPIGEVIDKAIDQRQHPSRFEDDSEILDVSQGDVRYLTQAFDPRTCEVGLYPIAAFVRHATPATMFDLTTQCGRSATFTGDHNLWVLRKGVLHLIRTDEVQTNDYIPLPETLLAEGSLDSVDLLPYLQDSGLYVDASESVNAYLGDVGRAVTLEALKASGTPSANSKLSSIRKTARGRGLAVNVLSSLIEKTDGLGGHWDGSKARVGGAFAQNSLPAKLPLSADFLRLIGYYIAEGNHQKGYIILANHDESIRHDIESIFNQMGMPFGVRPSSDYQISSTALSEILSCWCGNTARNKHLPDFWPQLSNEQLASIIRTYFDGDGTVGHASEVTAMTASKRLASDLTYALMRFGIWARITRRFKRATNTDHAGDWYYQVTISSQDNLRLFHQHIGFGLVRKQVLLEQQIIRDGNTNVDIVPIDGAQLRYLRETLGLIPRKLGELSTISRAAIQLYENGKRSPSRAAFKRILTALRDAYDARGIADTTWLRAWYGLQALTGLRWSKIKTVTPSEYDQPYVYDFCVPGVENFLAGHGGMFVHNTFVASQLIQELQRPTLVLAHNKTLAAQLYAEFKEFFPKNAVEYYVSYYDYYQPESYVPRFDLFIEKQTEINEHIERLRVASKAALLSRRDVLIVASVSCIYGTGDPDTWGKYILELRVGDDHKRENILRRLVQLQYARNDMDLAPGAFRVRGDTLEIHPFYEDAAYRVLMFDDDIERILRFDPLTGEILADQPVVVIFPAAQFVADKDKLKKALSDLEDELDQQIKFFKSQGKVLEAQRIEQRTRYDLEMLREVGFTSGIENYSRPLEQRQPGSAPHTLIDYFPDDYLLIIDESHMTIPQIRGMFNGDQTRKQTLVDYGFRLPSAMDNRPLRFDEFEERMGTTIFVSATPGPYELSHSEQVAQQVIRPTGILDPEVFVRPTKGQIDDLLQEVAERVKKGQRALITTFTQRMSEELAGYLNEMGIKAQYLHADVETLERVEILRDLRMGVYDVIVGINLLREGIDLPEVSLVGILDADKEGFLRSETALIQTIGRAARHIEGKVILYGDKMTDSMKAAIAETERRRAIQHAHNEANGIVPSSIVKSIRDLTTRVKSLATEGDPNAAPQEKPDLQTMNKADLHKLAKDIEQEMKVAARMMEFEKAAALRDQLFELRGILALKESDDAVSTFGEAPKDQKRASGGNKRRGR